MQFKAIHHISHGGNLINPGDIVNANALAGVDIRRLIKLGSLAPTDQEASDAATEDHIKSIYAEQLEEENRQITEAMGDLQESFEALKAEYDKISAENIDLKTKLAAAEEQIANRPRKGK